MWKRQAAALVCALLVLLAWSKGRAQASPDAVCAGCHRTIYDNYEQTPMARGSGPAGPALLPGEFSHAASGIRYALQREAGGRAVLRYTRAAPLLDGHEKLEYFIGSGKRGRTYLFQTDGYWFQSPVNFYTRSAGYEMAPGYSAVHEMPSNLRVDEGCLSCHSSGVQPTAAGSPNHFGDRPFTQNGITCARCHGDASAHVASRGTSPVLNPAKLDSTRRDAICQQCHLEGEGSVLLRGKTALSYKPGDDLFQSVAYYVHANSDGAGVRAVSQVEALAQSVCQRRSGAAMSCTSCHDPHRTIPAAERVSWYRGRCLSCHTSAKIAHQHHPEQPDCTACHMPTKPTTDIAHEQATDHRILKRPAEMPMDEEQSSRLVPVLGSSRGPRELGLAYAAFARKGDLFSLGEAVKLLTVADGNSSAVASSGDPDVLFALAQMYSRQGEGQRAAELYRRVYQSSPSYPGAAAAMGDLAAANGDMAQAALAWTHALEQDSADVALRQRLAEAECRLGDRAAAVRTLEQALPFRPDAPLLRSTLVRWAEPGEKDCSIR